MDRCICCGRELDYEGTLVCWACAKFGEGTDMWQYIIPAASAIVVAARDRSRAKKQAETLKRHELIGHYFAEAT